MVEEKEKKPPPDSPPPEKKKKGHMKVLVIGVVAAGLAAGVRVPFLRQDAA